MPELPDLLYIRDYLRRQVLGRTITAAELRQPVVLRNALGDPLEHALKSLTITRIDIQGPFLRLTVSATLELVINLMLAGQIQHQRKPDRALGHICVSLHLDDGTRLNICDQQKMAKVYLVHTGNDGAIPGFRTPGVNVFSPDFTPEELMRRAAEHPRMQVRVLINDRTILDSIGNAYADEILFAAQMHPKTLAGILVPEEWARLHDAIRVVMNDGVRAVADARQPIHVKVRDHMRVRNRKGSPCPRCGSTIRREGVRGYDVFFCPTCQPARRRVFIDWKKPPPVDSPDASHTETDHTA
jgi:formamidopyrimidine-DNA glycosylase